MIGSQKSVPLGQLVKAIRPALLVDSRAIERHGAFLSHFFAALAELSLRSALVSDVPCEDEVILAPSVDVIVHQHCRIPFLCTQYRQRFYEQLIRFKPTVLHCITESKALLTRQIAEKLRVPYVLTLYTTERIPREYVASAYCAKIVVPCETIRTHVAGLFPEMAEHVERVAMGAFVEEEIACFPSPGRLPSMIVNHPLDREADYEVLFSALRHLMIEGYEFMLVIIGEGKAQSQIRKLAKSMGLVGIINFAGEVGPVREVMVDSDIFIQPVPSSIYNAAILEAMSVGMVVVGCKGGVEDVLQENETALVFDHTNAESLHSSLKMLLDQREPAVHIARCGQQYLRREHTVTQMMDSLIRVYCDAVEHTRIRL